MTQVISKFLQVLDSYETPTFLISFAQHAVVVNGFNFKINSFFTSSSPVETPIQLETFFSELFPDKKTLYDQFLEQLNILLDQKVLNTDFKINSLHHDTQFHFQLNKLSSQDETLFLVHLNRTTTSKDLKRDAAQVEFYKTIFESLPIGIAVNRVEDWKTIFVNPKFEEIFESSLEKMKSASEFFKRIHPSVTYRGKLTRQILKDIESRDPKRMVWNNISITTLAGRKKTINATNIALHDENHMITTVEDVTEVYHTHLDLEIANQRLDKAFKATSDAVWEWTLGDSHLYWGDGYERLFGYKFKNNKVSKAFWESKIHPEDFNPFFTSLNQALEDHQLNKWSFVYRFLNSKNEYANVRENIVIVRDKDGQPVRLVGALQDITKATKRENHLHLLEKLVGGAKDAIIVTEVKSNSFLESKIVYANSSFQTLFGYDISSIIGQTPEQFYINPKNKQEFLKAEEKLSQWEDVDLNVLSLTQEDSEFWNNISISPIIDDQGWYTHWMIVNRDINDKQTNIEKQELLTFTHQVFQSDESLENSFCKLSLKFEDLLRNLTTEFWLLDSSTGNLSKYFGYKNGEDLDIKSIDQSSVFSDFRDLIFKKKGSQLQIHEPGENLGSDDTVKLSYGFQILFKDKPLGVVVLRFKDTYSKKTSLDTIFQEFSIQLGYELQRKTTETEINTFFTYTPDILCIAGTNGYLKRINKRASDILGYSKEEFLSTPFMNFVAETDHDIALSTLAKAKESPEYFNTEVGIDAKDGTVFYFDAHVFSVEGSQDVFCVGKNISTYKENLKKLETQYEKFNIIAETVNDAVWDFDLINHKIDWGSGLMTSFGYDPENFGEADEVWISKIHHNDRARVVKSFESCFVDKADDDWKEEYKFLKSDGTYADVLDRGTIIRDSSGLPIRMVGSIQDITELKKHAQKLEQLNQVLEAKTESLERSNQDLEEFAYIASHDLQEPLRMVTVFLTRLEEKYTLDLDDTARQYINFAVDGAKQMRLMIQSLLNFSKVAGHHPRFSQVDLNVILNKVKLLLSELIKEKEAEVIAEDLPTLFSEENNLKDVLLNLIENALKYSRKRVSPEVIIKYNQDKEHHILSVSDNGIGISEAYFEKIFGIFQRLHSQSEYSGTGIGLAIVKKIINNLKGHIRISSELDKGTTFYIYLPKKTITE